MKTTFRQVILLVAVALFLNLMTTTQGAAMASTSSYVEPGLLASTAKTLSVIVAANSSGAAAQRVADVGGQVTSDLWLIDSVAAVVPATQIPNLAAATGIRSIVANKGIKTSAWDGWVTQYPIPVPWDGRPDVQPTKNKRVWNIVNPVTIDIGADLAQKARASDGQLIKGNGVTVAVVDSGVYFDKEVKKELGNVVQKLYLGQADFVDSVCLTDRSGNKTKTIGTQMNGYCALTSKDSADGFGHGTAVASVIWNNFTDQNTGVTLGVAPDANILSVRVLNNDGYGTYETVIKGIQYVVQNKAAYNIRVLNLSLSAEATVPYFVDPINRAAESAWANGITVLAAAGNAGSAADTITVPGNDPYVITVGAVNENRTPGYWADDFLSEWSSTGPTADGFIKPDVLAPGSNIITFMYNDPDNFANSQKIVQIHPDYSATTSLFRMNGTSLSTAIASGVVALMLQAHPSLTPDQVKYRLMDTARPALAGDEQEPAYSILQQGMGRIWAQDAVLSSMNEGNGNIGMDIVSDLAHGYDTDADLAYHYQGPVREILSDDGQAYLYYVEESADSRIGLGVAWANTKGWVDYGTLAAGRMAWAGGRMAWAGGRMAWAGGRMAWAGGRMAWAGGRMAWAGGRMAWAGGRMAWAGSINTSTARIASTRWIADE
jgi:subtilisin family serine protease